MYIFTHVCVIYIYIYICTFPPRHFQGTFGIMWVWVTIYFVPRKFAELRDVDVDSQMTKIRRSQP